MSGETQILLVLVVAIALVFDFTNGFHDTANSIATMVGTRALHPQTAVLMAAILNFAGAFASVKVALTVGKELVPPDLVTLEVLLGALCGAIFWNLATWYVGLPSSSSHALFGGLLGASLANVGPDGVIWRGVLDKVMIPAVLAPSLGFLSAMLLAGLCMRLFRRARPRAANTGFRRAQIFSGAWLAFNHGKNDAQKTMGIIALALFTANGGGNPDDFTVPTWVIVSAASAMALGTYAGGWKIIKTLGSKMVRMDPVQGFAASTGGAGVLEAAAHFGLPVSTTHCISGSVLGSGAAKRVSGVRWSVAADMATAWVLTLPAAAMVGAFAFTVASVSPYLLVAGLVGTTVAFRTSMRRKQAAGLAAH